MKKIIGLLIAIMSVGVAPSNAQDLSADIVGKWQLMTVEMEGDKASAEEAFGMKLSQQYMADGKFIGRAGDETTKGTYTISDDGKTIDIVGHKLKALFQVVDFKVDKMTLDVSNKEGSVRLNYKKVVDK